MSRETDVRGYDWTPYVHPDDRQAYVGDYLAAVAARLPFAAQFRFRRVDGVYRWLQSVGTPRLLPDGTFLGYVDVASTLPRGARPKPDYSAPGSLNPSACSGRHCP